jgi:hypothetical protein
MEQVMQPADRAWSALLAASRVARNGLDRGRAASFAPDGSGGLREVASSATDATLAWRPAPAGRQAIGRRRGREPRHLPGAPVRRPFTLGHLGARRLRGHHGDRACHRDAEHVHFAPAAAFAMWWWSGRHRRGRRPCRRRARPPRPCAWCSIRGGDHRTTRRRRWRGCHAARLRIGARTAWRALGCAEVAGAPSRDGRFDLHAVLALLHRRGCHAVFVEGGGVTVSRFLEAGLLDRLHVAIAPLVIGHGRPGLQLPPVERLRDGLRPAHRVFRMGEDVLFDCDLRAGAPTPDGPAASPLVRIH